MFWKHQLPRHIAGLAGSDLAESEAAWFEIFRRYPDVVQKFSQAARRFSSLPAEEQDSAQIQILSRNFGTVCAGVLVIGLASHIRLYIESNIVAFTQLTENESIVAISGYAHGFANFFLTIVIAKRRTPSLLTEDLATQVQDVLVSHIMGVFYAIVFGEEFQQRHFPDGLEYGAVFSAARVLSGRWCESGDINTVEGCRRIAMSVEPDFRPKL